MAELRELNGERRCMLLPEHLVGRGPQCALKLTEGYVSGQHAVIRWNGQAWEVADRGSLNGTQVDGKALKAGQFRRLSAGSVLTFGNARERWELADESEPRVTVFSLDGSAQLFGEAGLIAVPSNEHPECTLFIGHGGGWNLEADDGSITPIANGHVFDAAQKSWQFSAPIVLEATRAAENQASAVLALHFKHTRDEEFVELFARYPGREIALGNRVHNYLLLLLARALLDDRKAGQPETAAGWLDKDDLAQLLKVTPQQIDGEVFRIRKHLAQRGVQDASGIVERRPGTKQIRLGVSDLSIESI